MKIVFLENLGCSTQLMEAETEKLKKMGHDVAICEGQPDKIAREIPEASVFVLANLPLPESAILNAPKLKFVDVAFTGVDHIPMPLLREKQIAVSNASGYSNDAVAELCISFMIQLLRDLPEAEKRAREGKTKAGLRANLLKGKTVGIIGAGAIGRQLAALCKAFGAKVLVHNRHIVEHPAIDQNVSLDELLQNSDIVSVHCPLTAETNKMLGAEEFGKMKKSAFLINAARGQVVDNEALAEALNNDVIAGAAIDVFELEPPLPEDYPLLKAKNIILSPHIGFYTQESLEERAKTAFKNIFGWLEGKQQNVVE